MNNELDTSPISDEEIEFLDNILLEYGNDDSILNVSELDGFFAAIVSGRDTILPSRWLPQVWGGADNEPDWKNEKEMEMFMLASIRLLNENAVTLTYYPDDYQAIFNMSKIEGKTYTIVEEWCFGYMRGVDLGGWADDLPPKLKKQLGDIALHGREENFDKLGKMSVEKALATHTKVEPAALAIHAYWLKQRTQ